jgi:hypothetical protein
VITSCSALLDSHFGLRACALEQGPNLSEASGGVRVDQDRVLRASKYLRLIDSFVDKESANSPLWQA